MKPFILLLIVASLLTAGASSAQDIVILESWAGIWETTTTEINCLTQAVVSVTTALDTLCAGNTWLADDPENIFVCNGSSTDLAVHLDCSATLDLGPECSLSMSFVSDATRDGEVATGVSVISFTYTGTGCFLPNTCVSQETSSVRTGDDPGCVATPVSEMRWGSLKSIYR